MDDRRSPGRGPRLSWAHGAPFRADTEPVVPGTRPRPPWLNRYQGSLVVVDAVVALVVTAAVLVTLPVGVVVQLVTPVLGAAAWLAVVAAARGYDRDRVGSGPEEFQSLARGAAVAAVGIAVMAYVTNTELPRRLVIVLLPVLLLVDGVARYALRRRLHLARHRGEAMLRTLLVGDATSMREVAEMLERSPHEGHQVVGVCSSGASAAPGALVPVLGAVSDVPQVVVDHEIDVVVVTGGHLRPLALRRLSWALEHTSARLVVAPGLMEVRGPRVSVRPVAGLSLLHIEPAGQRRAQVVGKVWLDRVLGAVLFTAAAPVIAVAAVATRATSAGPAFFRQERVGRDGRTFTMHKIRTMVVDAESRREHLLASSDRDGLMFKMRKDPRITPVGAVLRRYSLDELPQLWNVVRGDMSLVGPRPPLREEHERYHDEVYRRLRVRPGLTGLWQVSGRADLPWEEAVRLDLRYVDNWSVTMDLFILWKTFRAVMTGSGAY